MITIPIETSARHAHLHSEDWLALFGSAEPTVARQISQPPQYVAVERVTIAGPHGQIDDVAVVGPLRSYTQVELAMTDARRLGIRPPLSDSGHLELAADVTLIGPAGRVSRPAAIIQQRHIHANPTRAEQAGLVDQQIVSVKILGARGAHLQNVLVRVDERYTWQMHLDTDEANALGLGPNATGEIIPNE